MRSPRRRSGSPSWRSPAPPGCAPPANGAAGLTCRASSDAQTGYALLLGTNSTVQLARLEQGRVTLLKRHRLTPNERSDPGKPSLLRLACGSGEPGEPVTLGYTVNATPYGFVVDRNSVDPGASGNVGVVARRGVARFDDFALWLAS